MEFYGKAPELHLSARCEGSIYENSFESLVKFTVGMRDLILCLLPWEYKASITPIQEYILDIDILWGLTLQTFQVTN